MLEQHHLVYWQKRLAEEKQEAQQQTAQAWKDAQSIARLLRQQFGATQVILFGSLVKGRLTKASDIDIAVADVPEDQFFAAVAAVNRLSHRWVDLKPLEALESHFYQRVLETGKSLDETVESQ
ncbi:MAG: nucleotidyltransferase domain-containing protein [Oculatellaceae cyanobacterium Prado106]|nr:nucleotidyltransferase domain-containing protein [Oculatellaceae cyanobacterium Prado106]